MSLTESTPESAARAASIAARTLAVLPVSARNSALTTLHDALLANRETILAANAEDMARATEASQSGHLSSSVLKRLDLSRPGKFADMIAGILNVRDLDDPIGKVDLRTLLDDGLILERVSCPIGVLLIIFEARPEVIANIAALAIKSGNAAILKGGKESSASFETIAKIIGDALNKTQVPNAAIQLVKTRDVIDELLGLDRYIDLVIPRGGNELVRYVKEHTKIPVLGHADGLCSIYLHSDAEKVKDLAVKVVVDAKCDYPAACNAVETLLVHENVLRTVLPDVAEALLAKGVSLRCDEKSKAALEDVLSARSSVGKVLLQEATEEDYNTEFLDLVLAVKTVPATTVVKATTTTNGHDGEAATDDEDQSLDLAIAHINTHGSKHTDCIVTASEAAAEKFMSAVDSAGVYWNASTRFADGMRYGFGTEVGISTNKIHSRGPVGLEGLTIYKYKLRGHGQVAGDYGEGKGKRRFKHERID
ncbi:glutamate-5-semialdehyde dehydrogenase [Exophiala dermatitidis]|uniref:glutamate-5-semialdehyde dehydrogenase n=2 Tax=Exophiala dermatitidis TaxID=5970 RepID=H6C4M9_EXODN|nr:glutamate-5-semialdehyde dehydrogenase [Exophiala dermatitidis NIH/UT8656]KAJ4509198.1 glutamate-5-semialdehyde dehydrogenase [Exophiala dermatitidis]EHY58511.1 glutamate-5-semialdehyde dehydrogenase [Exophiala dermatitidis NIH/UT8656]KAJ4511075.1 glutamate-5-semialdehyde dehydrogenase [Exophiala dermatitidis]KAJ4511990.1 glutamate-5-semialdehyde dehydrogenase [Exophiala dermatitidis]KAJ4534855.1 glutamate-5-semialdehyde dehydrogenase [Exophiala dermatitidis]